MAKIPVWFNDETPSKEELEIKYNKKIDTIEYGQREKIIRVKFGRQQSYRRRKVVEKYIRSIMFKDGTCTSYIESAGCLTKIMGVIVVFIMVLICVTCI